MGEIVGVDVRDGESVINVFGGGGSRRVVSLKVMLLVRVVFGPVIVIAREAVSRDESKLKKRLIFLGGERSILKRKCLLARKNAPPSPPPQRKRNF